MKKVSLENQNLFGNIWALYILHNGIVHLDQLSKKWFHFLILPETTIFIFKVNLSNVTLIVGNVEVYDIFIRANDQWCSKLKLLTSHVSTFSFIKSKKNINEKSSMSYRQLTSTSLYSFLWFLHNRNTFNYDWFSMILCLNAWMISTNHSLVITGQFRIFTVFATLSTPDVDVAECWLNENL